jgi:chromosome segregation ATPase
MSKDLKTFFGQHHGLDERSMESLTQALVRENLPGFDYIEFKQALFNLQTIGIAEETAFKSAFATASTMGLTKEKLLKTANHYKQILLKEKQSFDSALQKQIDQRVEGKRREVETLKKQVEEYRAKISQLEAQIAKSLETIQQADQTIQTARENIDGVKEKFEDTLTSIVKQMDNDISDIDRYL